MGNMFKKRKTQKQKNKESRAKKFNPHPRYHKHEVSPVWVEEYYEEQYYSCDSGDMYDEPCGKCHDCLGKQPLSYPSGDYVLTFEFVKTR